MLYTNSIHLHTNAEKANFELVEPFMLHADMGLDIGLDV